MDSFSLWLEGEDFDHTKPLPKSFQQQFWYAHTSQDALHHTTSLSNALEILKSRTLKGKDYVSFWRGDASVNDISNHGATIVFNGPAIRKLVMPVHYTPKWFNKYPSHGHYIAGDHGGWGDDALDPVDNFMYKSGENEWISRKEGWLKFPKRAVVALLIPDEDEESLRLVSDEVRRLGYDINVESD